MQSVLLLPGEDYNARNAAQGIQANNMIIQHLTDYVDTSLMISTNQLFYDADNKYLKQRKILDAREYLAKQKLKNNAEIANICDQIIDGLSELRQQELSQ